jgi:hypothetical protein
MNQTDATNEVQEVAPEAILRQIAYVLEAAIPGISLTPSLGDPVPLSSVFEADQLDEVDAAGDQMVRSLGMCVALRGESWGGGFATTTDPTPERWVDFARQILSDIQDAISKSTTNPWPEVRADGRRSQAPEGAALEGRFLRMWFGDRQQPVIMFEPIEVIVEGREEAG